MSTRTKESVVRAVTDEEVEHFFEYGWVKIPGLVDRSFANELLDAAKGVFGPNGDAPREGEGNLSWFRTVNRIGEENELFHRLGTATELGRNAARLFGRNSAVRLMEDSLMVKLPAAAGSTQAAATAWHQDTGAHFFSEANSVNAWMALDEVKKDMGAMQFFGKSHRFGPLGNLMDATIWEGWQEKIERFCQPSGPVELEPGDATFHTHLMIHGTQENKSTSTRWSWGGMLLPADARFTGAQSYYTDGLGLEPWGSLEHEKFPITYNPED